MMAVSLAPVLLRDPEKQENKAEYDRAGHKVLFRSLPGLPEAHTCALRTHTNPGLST